MVYKNYNLLLIIRIILLLAGVFLTGSTFLIIGKRDILFLPIVLSCILFIQVVEIIWFLNRTSSEIGRFVTNLGEGDLSEKFDEKNMGPPFSNLYRAFNKVITSLENSSLEKEAQYAYLQNILSNIDTGILSVREDGQIMLINESAMDLLGVKDYASWKDVARLHPEFDIETGKIRGRGNRLIEIELDGSLRLLSVNQSLLKIRGTSYRILTFQDIRTEIEQKEIEAWHKLIQILRHEIRNSVTPIASMTETILMLLENQSGVPKTTGELKEKDLEDIYSSLRTVHNRSEGLYTFVEKYRQLTKVPPPQKSELIVHDIIKSLSDLFAREAGQESINIIAELPANDIKMEADPSLVEQVLINLVRNGIDALKNQSAGVIRIYSGESDKNVFISVEDNGPGIDPSIISDIFLPFFTTKQNGMGVGLSLSRQIMNLHGGTLTVDSQPGDKTVFRLVFRK